MENSKYKKKLNNRKIIKNSYVSKKLEILIKNNNVKEFLDSNLKNAMSSRVRKVVNNSNDYEQNLSKLKNKHDKLKQIYKIKDKNINILNTKWDNLSIKEKIIFDEKGDLEQNITKIKDKNKEILLENDLNTLKIESYKNKLNILNQDYILKSKNVNNLDYFINKKLKEIEDIKKIYNNLSIENCNLKIIYEDLKSEYKNQKIDRKSKLENLNLDNIKLKEKEFITKNRLENENKLAQNTASNCKSNSEKEYKNLMYTMKLFNYFIRHKAKKEYDNYKKLENCFIKIKNESRIDNPNEISHKFLNKESIFSQLFFTLEEAKTKLNETKKLKNDILLKEKITKNNLLLNHSKISDDVIEVDKNKEHKLKKQINKKVILYNLDILLDKCITKLKNTCTIEENKDLNNTNIIDKIQYFDKLLKENSIII